MIEYKKKDIIDIGMEGVIGTNINYIIETDNPDELVKDIMNELDITSKLTLYKDNLVDLIIDTPENGLVNTIGINSSDNIVFMHFKITEGLDKFLMNMGNFN